MGSTEEQMNKLLESELRAMRQQMLEGLDFSEEEDNLVSRLREVNRVHAADQTPVESDRVRKVTFRDNLVSVAPEEDDEAEEDYLDDDEGEPEGEGWRWGDAADEEGEVKEKEKTEDQKKTESELLAQQQAIDREEAEYMREYLAEIEREDEEAEKEEKRREEERRKKQESGESSRDEGGGGGKKDEVTEDKFDKSGTKGVQEDVKKPAVAIDSNTRQFVVEREGRFELVDASDLNSGLHPALLALEDDNSTSETTNISSASQKNTEENSTKSIDSASPKPSINSSTTNLSASVPISTTSSRSPHDHTSQSDSTSTSDSGKEGKGNGITDNRKEVGDFSDDGLSKGKKREKKSWERSTTNPHNRPWTTMPDSRLKNLNIPYQSTRGRRPSSGNSRRSDGLSTFNGSGLNDAVKSVYALPEDEKEKIQKRLEKMEIKRRKEEEERRLMEWEKRKQGEDAWRSWVERKKEIKKKERSEGTDDSSSITIPCPDSKTLYDAWRSQKKQQELHERQIERHKAKEEEEAHVIRSREECDKAFRDWLRRKAAENRAVKAKAREKEKKGKGDGGRQQDVLMRSLWAAMRKNGQSQNPYRPDFYPYRY